MLNLLFGIKENMWIQQKKIRKQTLNEIVLVLIFVLLHDSIRLGCYFVSSNFRPTFIFVALNCCCCCCRYYGLLFILSPYIVQPHIMNERMFICRIRRANNGITITIIEMYCIGNTVKSCLWQCTPMRIIRLKVKSKNFEHFN